MAVALNVIKRTMMKWVGEIIDGLAELNAYCCHEDNFHLNFASSSSLLLLLLDNLSIPRTISLLRKRLKQ